LKIGINAWAFPDNLTIPQGLKLAKRAGFDCVELNVAESGSLTPDSTEEEVSFLRTSAENMTIELKSLCGGLLWRNPLTSNAAALAERGKEIVRKCLQVCKWLGADTLLVIPGVVTEDVPYDLAYERSLAALKELAGVAEKLGVHIGVENVWNKFLLSPLEMRDFVDAVASPMVGVYFDAGNVLVNGYPDHWIKILGPRILKVHVKDFHAGIGNITGFANLLEGDLNWRGVERALREVGYNDVVTAEIAGYKTLPDLGVRHAGESMKRIFKGAS
jgi:hexulose-6-phosphate isomerase